MVGKERRKQKVKKKYEWSNEEKMEGKLKEGRKEEGNEERGKKIA